MPKLSQYELDRLQNIKRNMALLTSLDIHTDLFPPKEVRRPKKLAAPKKRKSENDDPSGDSPPKFARTDITDEPLSGARRSARNAGKKINYTGEQIRSLPDPVSSRSKKLGNAGPLGTGSGNKMYVFPLYTINVSDEVSALNLELFLASRLGHGGQRGIYMFSELFTCLACAE